MDKHALNVLTTQHANDVKKEAQICVEVVRAVRVFLDSHGVDLTLVNPNAETSEAQRELFQMFRALLDRIFKGGSGARALHARSWMISTVLGGNWPVTRRLGGKFTDISGGLGIRRMHELRAGLAGIMGGGLTLESTALFQLLTPNHSHDAGSTVNLWDVLVAHHRDIAQTKSSNKLSLSSAPRFVRYLNADELPIRSQLLLSGHRSSYTFTTENCEALYFGKCLTLPQPKGAEGRRSRVHANIPGQNDVDFDSPLSSLRECVLQLDMLEYYLFAFIAHGCTPDSSSSMAQSGLTGPGAAAMRQDALRRAPSSNNNPSSNRNSMTGGNSAAVGLPPGLDPWSAIGMSGFGMAGGLQQRLQNALGGMVDQYLHNSPYNCLMLEYARTLLPHSSSASSTSPLSASGELLLRLVVELWLEGTTMIREDILVQQKLDRDMRRRGTAEPRTARNLNFQTASERRAMNNAPPSLRNRGQAGQQGQQQLLERQPGTPMLPIEASSATAAFSPFNKLVEFMGGNDGTPSLDGNHSPAGTRSNTQQQQQQQQQQPMPEEARDVFADLEATEVPFPHVELHDRVAFQNPTEKELQSLLILLAHLLSDPAVPRAISHNGSLSKADVLPPALRILRQPLRMYLQLVFEQMSANRKVPEFVLAVEVWYMWLCPWQAGSKLHSNTERDTNHLMFTSVTRAIRQVTDDIRKAHRPRSRDWDYWLLENQDVYGRVLITFIKRMRELEFGGTNRDAQLLVLERILSAYTPDVVDYLAQHSMEWEKIMMHLTSQEEAVDFLDDLQFKILYGGWLPHNLDWDDWPAWIIWAFVLVFAAGWSILELLVMGISSRQRLGRIEKQLCSIFHLTTGDGAGGVSRKRSGSVYRYKRYWWAPPGWGRKRRVMWQGPVIQDVWAQPLCSYELGMMVYIARYISLKLNRLFGLYPYAYNPARTPFGYLSINLRFIADMRNWLFAGIIYSVMKVSWVRAQLFSYWGLGGCIFLLMCYRYPQYWFRATSPRWWREQLEAEVY